MQKHERDERMKYSQECFIQGSREGRQLDNVCELNTFFFFFSIFLSVRPDLKR